MNVPPFGISCLSSVFSIGRLSIGNPKCYLFIFHVYMKYMYTHIYCVYTDIFCKHTQPIYYVLHIHMPIFSVYTETHVYCIYIDTYCIHTHTFSFVILGTEAKPFAVNRVLYSELYSQASYLL